MRQGGGVDHLCQILKPKSTWAQVLSDESAERVAAACEGIRVFVDTLMLVTGTQNALAAAGGGGGPPAAARSPAAAPPPEVTRKPYLKSS